MRLIFIARQQITDTVASFVFRPVEPVQWTAGQSIRLELPASDYGSNERRFSISSAPYENVITITTRPSTSDFKQSLFALQPGDKVDGYNIEGNFVWSGGAAPVFVAGGIGITPFYAMLKQRVHQGLPIATSLFYGSRRGELPFSAELQQWQQLNPEFTLHMFAKPIDSDILRASITDMRAAQFYISGPQAFVQELGLDLTNLGAQNIKSDLFTGKIEL